MVSQVVLGHVTKYVPEEKVRRSARLHARRCAGERRTQSFEAKARKQQKRSRDGLNLERDHDQDQRRDKQGYNNERRLRRGDKKVDGLTRKRNRNRAEKLAACGG